MSRKTDTQKRKEAMLRELIERRGLRIEGGGRHGYVRVRGVGVDVKAPKLADLDERDLQPSWYADTY